MGIPLSLPPAMDHNLPTYRSMHQLRDDLRGALMVLIAPARRRAAMFLPASPCLRSGSHLRHEQLYGLVSMSLLGYSCMIASCTYRHI
jgi:hypothetical protein